MVIRLPIRSPVGSILLPHFVFLPDFANAVYVFNLRRPCAVSPSVLLFSVSPIWLISVSSISCQYSPLERVKFITKRHEWGPVAGLVLCFRSVYKEFRLNGPVGDAGIWYACVAGSSLSRIRVVRAFPGMGVGGDGGTSVGVEWGRRGVARSLGCQVPGGVRRRQFG